MCPDLTHLRGRGPPGEELAVPCPSPGSSQDRCVHTSSPGDHNAGCIQLRLVPKHNPLGEPASAAADSLTQLSQVL